MDLRRILVLMLFVLVLGSCQDSPTIQTPVSMKVPIDFENVDPTTIPKNTQTQEEPEDGESFALILVDDPQIAGSDLSDWALEGLPLVDDPLISTEDILFYDWENHAFYVIEKSYQHIIEEISGSVPVNGRPFVVVANGERIYAGVFWTLASSLSFDGMVIMDPAFASNGSILLTLGYPTEEYFNGEDPRDDSRIWEALEASGLLQ